MAELATIARPYAEALFKAVGDGDAPALVAQLGALAAVAADPQMRQFADNPKVAPAAGARPADRSAVKPALARRRRRRTCCAP